MNPKSEINPKPSTRLGRTALIVLLGGLSTSAVMIVTTTFLGSSSVWSRTQDLMPVYALALAIGGVSTVWAILLAIRAVRSGESAYLPLWVFNLATLPPGLYGLAHWFELPEHTLLRNGWVLDYYLPVFLPFLMLACITGTLLVRPLMRWLIRRRTTKCKPEWTRSDRIRRSVAFLSVYTLLGGILTLPVALYTSAVLNVNLFMRDEAWINSAPEFVSNAVERVLRLDLNNAWHQARYSILCAQGRVSLERLKELFNTRDTEMQNAVMRAVVEKDPTWATERAMDVIMHLPSSGLMREVDADFIIGWHGTVAQQTACIEYLKNVTEGDSLGFLLMQIEPTAPLIPVLKEILQSSTQGREHALPVLSRLLSEQQLEALMIEILRSNDRVLQDAIIDRRMGLRDRRVATHIFLHLMEQPDLALRRHALKSIDLTMDSHPLVTIESTALQCKTMQKVLPLLSSEDIPTRRAGAFFTYRFLVSISSDTDFDSVRQAGGALRPVNDLTYPTGTSGGAPAPQMPREIEAINTLRTLTEEWIAEHEPAAK